MQEYAKESHKNMESSGQTTEFDNTENRTFMHDLNPAQNSSVGPIEDVSEDFSKMNGDRSFPYPETVNVRKI